MKQISMQQHRKSAGIFMLLLSIFMAMAIASSAQKSFSVSVTSPTPGMTMVKGQKYNLEFKVTNTGMKAIAAMDTIMVDVTVNGKSAYMGGTILMTPINMGAYQSFQVKDFTYSGITANTDNGSLCVKVMIPNNTNSGNGQGCQTVKLRLAPSGVSEHYNASFIDVYPNPAGAYLKIRPTRSVEGSVRLFDMSGREVSKTDMTGSEATIETANFPAGLYFYRLSDKAGVVLQTGKVSVGH